ncbi:MAG: EamA family transporter [Alphaproteobacteria bacterium]|nr:EamA family transporter [Alphaproteobacteria bacterium]
MLGAALALLSAVTFGMNNAAARRGVITGSVLQGLAITVPIGVPLFALLCLFTGGFAALAGFSGDSWLWFSAAGIVHFIVGRYGNYRANKCMGAALSSPFQQMSLLVALMLALVFLDDFVTPLKLFGIVLVFLGPAVMLRGMRKGKKKKSGSDFTPKYAEGILWGLVCAFGYGVSPLLVQIGLAGGGMVDGIAGGLISYGAASVIVLALLMLPGNIAHMKGLDRTNAKWFTASGVFVFLAQVFRYMALAIAPVSVVVPVQRLSVVFRVIFSWMLNREHEVITFWVIAGIGLSFLGAMALTISTEFILELVPLPEALTEIARWRWP